MIKYEVMTSLEDVLEHMHLFLGPHSQEFEKEFAAYCGCEYVVGLSSGADAFTLALRASGIGSGDEVITVANTFIATVEAIAQVGATPVFVDIDPETYTMDWRQLDSVLTPSTCAIIPVHLYGHPVEMQPVMEFARRHGLHVIEDASQAHGAIYRGQRVGSFGEIGCFSLYYSKNLGAYGEVGICVTNNSDLAASLHMLRDHGSRIRYEHEMVGVNARLDELQAAILRVKIRYLERWNDARQMHARAYTRHLQGMLEAVPVIRPWATHVFYVYVVQVQGRDHFCQILEQKGWQRASTIRSLSISNRHAHIMGIVKACYQSRKLRRNALPRYQCILSLPKNRYEWLLTLSKRRPRESMKIVAESIVCEAKFVRGI